MSERGVVFVFVFFECVCVSNFVGRQYLTEAYHVPVAVCVVFL